MRRKMIWSNRVEHNIINDFKEAGTDSILSFQNRAWERHAERKREIPQTEADNHRLGLDDTDTVAKSEWERKENRSKIPHRDFWTPKSVYDYVYGADIPHAISQRKAKLWKLLCSLYNKNAGVWKAIRLLTSAKERYVEKEERKRDRTHWRQRVYPFSLETTYLSSSISPLHRTFWKLLLLPLQYRVYYSLSIVKPLFKNNEMK